MSTFEAPSTTTLTIICGAPLGYGCRYDNHKVVRLCFNSGDIAIAIERRGERIHSAWEVVKRSDWSTTKAVKISFLSMLRALILPTQGWQVSWEAR